MIRILLSGCCGKMGRNVITSVNSRKDCEIVAGIDIVDDSSIGFPVFQNYNEVNVKADVIIDFSNPALLSDMLEFAKNVIVIYGIFLAVVLLITYIVSLYQYNRALQDTKLYYANLKKLSRIYSGEE